MTLFDELMALVDEMDCAEPNGQLAVAAALFVLNRAAKRVEDEEIYPEERWGGIYNVAVKSCANAVRSMREELGAKP